MKGTTKEAFIKYKNCILPQIWTTSVTSLHKLNEKKYQINSNSVQKSCYYIHHKIESTKDTTCDRFHAAPAYYGRKILQPNGKWKLFNCGL